MSQITKTFQNSGSFTIAETRYNAIVEQSKHDADWVDSTLFHDWDNVDDHQEWLNNANISEIVDWANDIVDSWK